MVVVVDGADGALLGLRELLELPPQVRLLLLCLLLRLARTRLALRQPVHKLVGPA
jgi:hypothetical protein